MLRIFEAVADTGNVSRAADKLGITQSAVSQALAQVERILGTQVFDRAHRPFTLTPAGIALSRRARPIVDDIDRLVSDVREADLASRPAIRVGMIDSFAATAGPAIAKKVTASASQLLLSFLRPLPSMSWIPLSLLWFGITETQKYSIVFMGTFAPALVYVIEATRNVDPLLIRAAQNLGASRWQVMREVILPGSLPQILSGMKVILGLAWTCVISAELIAAREGLGFLIMNGKEFFQTEVVVLGMVMISITVLITDFVFRLIENHILRWQQ
ncbi:MAG: ABC transporter permease subunit [Alcaligenaceae bacterium]|nr:ABC transporter permease subunit [Alcaligenaceae bacterium]